VRREAMPDAGTKDETRILSWSSDHTLRTASPRHPRAESIYLSGRFRRGLPSCRLDSRQQSCGLSTRTESGNKNYGVYVLNKYAKSEGI
jgi:hypothetical protein